MVMNNLLDNKDTKLEAGEAIFTKENVDVNIKPNVQLIGLTKEQLEQYRNDPFWKTIRYFSFALFWIIWGLMFGAAIWIVVKSPKCEPYDFSTIRRIFTAKFYGNDGIGNFKAIKERLNELHSNGIKSIAPTPLFTTLNYEPESVIEYGKIEKRFGSTDDLKDLIKGAHDLKISFVADVPLAINTNSSEWDSTDLKAKENNLFKLNIEKKNVIEKVVQASTMLLKLGADAIYLNSHKTNIENESVANLAKSIREAADNNKEVTNKNFIIIFDRKSNTNFTQIYLTKDNDEKIVSFTDKNSNDKHLNK